MNLKFKECRKNLNLTQAEMAAILEITEISYQRYELGTRQPTHEALLFLSDFFGVSLDFLFSRSDDPRREEFSYRREEILQKIKNNSQSEK